MAQNKGLFESCLVGNTEDRLSCDKAHFTGIRSTCMLMHMYGQVLCDTCMFHNTTLTNFSRNYLVMCKNYTGVGGINYKKVIPLVFTCTGDNPRALGVQTMV